MMQTGELGITWNHIVGAVVGYVVAGGGLAGCFLLKERRRAARKERPPQPEKVLRPAGYSVVQRVDALWEKLMFAAGQSILGGMLTGLVVGGFYPVIEALILGKVSLAQLRGVPKAYLLLCGLLLGVGSLLFTIQGFLRLSKLYDGVRAWRFGLRGEQAVAEKLSNAALLTAGYVVFHDLPAKRGKKEWNVDHVVVGPAGVFVLETKARPRRKATIRQEENVVVFDGETLQFPWCFDRKAAGQVAANARWVRALIAKFAPEGIVVQPVIVVPGWYVKSSLDFPVWAMNAKYLVDVLVDRKAVFRAEELRGVIAKLDEECRVLEF